jgi:hypothetical protein
VITGGEHPVAARAATNLWLLGANILITFGYGRLISFRCIALVFWLLRN